MRTNTKRATHPLLSIVVPTRNRAAYAIPAIRSLLAIPSADFELVIQDNSDDGELGRFFETLAPDERLCYSHVSDRLDVVANFTRGTELAAGEFIAFLGDDDGATPEVVDAASWARAQGLDAVTPSTPAQYWWPDHRFRFYGAAFAGSLDLQPFSGRITRPDPETEMRRCARVAGYHFGKLPKIYHGIVRRQCLDKVKSETGTYFPGPSPDLAGAMAVANYVESMVYIDYPLFIPGASPKSGAGLGSEKKHVGRLKDWAHLPPHYVNNWSDLVPDFWSGTTIWGEDVVQALIATGRKDLLDEFNIPLLHAFCAAFNPAFAKYSVRHMYKALKIKKDGYTKGTVNFAIGFSLAYTLRARKLLIRYLHKLNLFGWETIGPLEDIRAATQALCQHLSSTNSTFFRHV